MTKCIINKGNFYHLTFSKIFVRTSLSLGACQYYTPDTPEIAATKPAFICSYVRATDLKYNFSCTFIQKDPYEDQHNLVISAFVFHTPPQSRHIHRLHAKPVWDVRGLYVRLMSCQFACDLLQLYELKKPAEGKNAARGKHH